MTKKDYQAIARAFHKTRPPHPSYPGEPLQHEEAILYGVWCMNRDAIADVLAADNPRFNRARFLEACETGTCKGMKSED